MAAAPRSVEGPEPGETHQPMAQTLDDVAGRDRAIQQRARQEGELTRPRWPMIVLRTPKGWTGPTELKRAASRGIVPLPSSAARPRSGRIRTTCRRWSVLPRTARKSSSTPAVPDEAEISALAPTGDRRMSANPHTNGGPLTLELGAAGLPRVCGGSHLAGVEHERGHASAGRLAARCDPVEP